MTDIASTEIPPTARTPTPVLRRPAGVLPTSRRAGRPRLGFAAVCAAAAASVATAASPPVPVPTPDLPLTLAHVPAFPLAGALRLPAGATKADLEKVVVLLHGAGPQSMDSDLAAVTEGKRPNPFFRDLTDHLVAAGLGVIRYHKRSHQAGLRQKADSTFKDSESFKAFAADPLGAFLADAAAALDWAARELPAASRVLLGHSQGCYLALQLTRTRPDLAGVGLIGLGLQPLDTLVFEQTAYRPLAIFGRVDGDGDGRLTDAELAADDPEAAALRAQLAVLDLDGDGAIGRSEFVGGNLSNGLLKDMFSTAYRVAEARLPTLPAILRGLEKPLAVFQGEWDNQTPAHNARAVQLAARHVWKRPWAFRFYPGRGHALDPRDRYDDLVYRRADPAALADVAAVTAALGAAR